jgi:hypothetical protein
VKFVLMRQAKATAAKSAAISNRGSNPLDKKSAPTNARRSSKTAVQRTDGPYCCESSPRTDNDCGMMMMVASSTKRYAKSATASSIVLHCRK